MCLCTLPPAEVTDCKACALNVYVIVLVHYIIINHFSIIEWHYNITEYSYANHDNYPHLHKQEQLFYISFINNNFYENPVYKESSKRIMFIPLRKGCERLEK
jgi:hypothetical protein